MRNKLFITIMFSSILLSATSAFAEVGDDPNEYQPYIEELKKKHGIPESAPQPMGLAPTSEQVERETVTQTPESDDPNEVQPYIQQLKEREGLTENPPTRTEQNLQPYIDELKMGRELKADMRKTVDEAAGFAVVASNKFDVHSDRAQANAFESVYNPSEKYSPSFDLFYERQLYRSRYWGAIGPVFHGTFIQTKGKGIFTTAGVASNDIIFKFTALALSAGLSYRATLLRYIQPFVQGSVVAIPFMESRNDDRPSKRGISRGFSGIGGVALNLDWIGRKNAWDQYDSHGILHTYFVAQVEHLRSVSSSIQFNYTGVYGGLMFEF